MTIKTLGAHVASVNANAAGQALAIWLNAVDEGQHFLVGCSGGLDSLTLTIALGILRPNRVRACYVNHGLHPDAAYWGEHTERQLSTFQIPLISQRVKVPQGNIEAAARTARREALLQQLQPGEWLVLAHHRQDQAETVLLRLVRGSGAAGLAGMASCKSWQNQMIVRPWLQTARSDIQQLAEQLGLTWINDPANQALEFDRVWLRQQWPLWQARWPQWEQSLTQTANRMQDTAALLADLAAQDLDQITVSLEKCREQLACGGLRLAELPSAARQRNLLYHWFRENISLSDALPASQIEQLRELTEGATFQGAWGEVLRWQSVWWWRRRHTLRYQLILQQSAHKAEIVIEQGQHTWRYLITSNHTLVQLTLHPRQGGEQMQLIRRTHHTRLKKWLQSAELSLWQRQAALILLNGEGLILGVWLPSGWLITQAGQDSIQMTEIKTV